MKTANGVPIVDGLRVINSDMRVGKVILPTTGPHRPELEGREWWFYMIVDGNERPTLVSESRVSTRHPFTGAAI